jgi:hypothetical protein
VYLQLREDDDDSGGGGGALSERVPLSIFGEFDHAAEGTAASKDFQDVSVDLQLFQGSFLKYKLNKIKYKYKLNIN